MSTRWLALVLLLSALAQTASAGIPKESWSDFRLIALRKGPGPQRVVMGYVDGRGSMTVAPGPVFADAEILSVSWQEGSVQVRLKKDDPNRKLLRPYEDWTRRPFGILHGRPFANEGCPLFLARVDADQAWVRTGGPTEEKALRVGDELCGGWLVQWLRADAPGQRGLLTLSKSDELLRVASAPP